MVLTAVLNRTGSTICLVFGSKVQFQSFGPETLIALSAYVECDVKGTTKRLSWDVRKQPSESLVRNNEAKYPGPFPWRQLLNHCQDFVLNPLFAR